MMETEFWRIDYISCEGNDRWTVVETPVGVTEDDLSNQLLSDYGYDDAPSKFVSCEPWHKDEYGMYTDWTHIEVW